MKLIHMPSFIMLDFRGKLDTIIPQDILVPFNSAGSEKGMSVPRIGHVNTQILSMCCAWIE